MIILTLLIFSSFILSSEKDIPKVKPTLRTVIIYPPQTAEEFMARHKALEEILRSPPGGRLIFKDPEKKDKS